MTPTNGNCFIVPRFNTLKKSRGGVWLDKQLYRSLPSTGQVFAVPAGEHEIKPGDHVVYNGKKSSLDKVKTTEGHILAVVPLSEVMAIVSDVDEVDVRHLALNE